MGEGKKKRLLLRLTQEELDAVEELRTRIGTEHASRAIVAAVVFTLANTEERHGLVRTIQR